MKRPSENNDENRMPSQPSAEVDDNENLWVWQNYGQVKWGSLKYEGERFHGVIWSCDGCRDVLNNQDGFTDLNDTWCCRKCSYENKITAANIYEDAPSDEKIDETIEKVNSAVVDICKHAGQSSLSEEQFSLMTEEAKFLVDTSRDEGAMMLLGCLYYEKKDFDLALKYYEMAAECDCAEAYRCLGYMWFYGRTGKKDYKKACQYFEKAADNGDIQSAGMLAEINRITAVSHRRKGR